MSGPGKVYQKLSPGWLIMLINELVYITLPDIAKQFHFVNIVYVAVINHTVLFLIVSLFHHFVLFITVCRFHRCCHYRYWLLYYQQLSFAHSLLRACCRLQETTKTESAFCSL